MNATPAAPTSRTPSARFLRCRARLRPGLALLLASAAAACTFEGYVPTMKPPELAASELEIADLGLGQSAAGSLDCAQERCRARHRVVITRPGRLVVSVSGPVGDERTGGPRLARVVLEGLQQETLDAEFAGGVSPLVVESDVKPGVHFVLVQGMTGAFDYRVETRFTPSDEEPVVAAEPPRPQDREPPAATTGGILPPPRSSAKPGDLRDGADFAYDPRRDLRTLRRYAFAQDPAAMLRGEPGQSVGDPFLQKQVQREIRYFLSDLSIEEAPANQADFLISVQLGSRSTTWYSINDTLYDRPYDHYFDAWSSVGFHVRRHSYRDGMLMIDFIDAKSGELLWHGWTVEPLSPSARDDSVVKQAVRNVLSQF